MVDDARRDEVIVTLADALLESSRCRVHDQGVRACARRLDAESPEVPPLGRPDSFSLTARRMKFLTLEGATVRTSRQLAAQALGAHAETIAQARIAPHYRRSMP